MPAADFGIGSVHEIVAHPDEIAAHLVENAAGL
jgi:hypothetical protein